MFANFIVSNAILWLSLYATALMSQVLPGMLIEFGLFEWLGSIVSGAIIGALIGRSYDELIKFVSTILPIPITEQQFGVAASISVALILIAATGFTVPILQNPKEYPLAYVVVLAIWAGCSYEVWKMWPASSAPPFAKLIISCTLAMVLCIFTVMGVAYVITQFVQFYNIGMASFMAGWAAGLTSWMFKKFVPQLKLENKASHKFVEAVVQREGAILLAVVVAYVIFKINGTVPILFSVAVGFLSALIAPVIGQFWHSD